MPYEYRYFRRPHAFSTFRADAAECQICRATSPGYAGPYYGAVDLLFVCEACLHGGRLEQLDCSTNDPDVTELRGNLALAHPGIESSPLKTLVDERTSELIYRTPHLTSWQDFFWPAHCTDYCRYEKEAGRLDFANLAGTSDPKKFFIEHLYSGYRETDLDDLWESLREDSPADNSVAYETTAYLFSCLVCLTPVVLWDCS